MSETSRKVQVRSRRASASFLPLLPLCRRRSMCGTRLCSVTAKTRAAHPRIASNIGNFGGLIAVGTGACALHPSDLITPIPP